MEFDVATFSNTIEYIEKKSKFIGYLLVCKNVGEVEDALKELKK